MMDASSDHEAEEEDETVDILRARDALKGKRRGQPPAEKAEG